MYKKETTSGLILTLIFVSLISVCFELTSPKLTFWRPSMRGTSSGCLLTICLREVERSIFQRMFEKTILELGVAGASLMRRESPLRWFPTPQLRRG